MLSLLNIIRIIIFGILLPLVIGYPGAVLRGERGKISIFSLVFGISAEMAVFYILSVPMIYFRTSFSMLKYTWLILMAVLFSAGLFMLLRDRKKFKETEGNEGKGLLVKEGMGLPANEGKGLPANEGKGHPRGFGKVCFTKMDRLTRFVWAAFIFMAAFETMLLTSRMHMDTDDARFVAEALEAVEKDTMYAYQPVTGRYSTSGEDEKLPGMPTGEHYKDMASPYPIFLGLLSDLFDLNPAIVSHTVLPFLLIPLSFMVFYMAGSCIFAGDLKKNGYFLLFLSVIHLFSFETTFAPGYTLLNVIWQGRSMGAMIFLPFLWLLLISEKNCGVNSMDAGGRSAELSTFFLVFVTGLACDLLSGTIAVLSAMMTFAFALYILLKDHRIRAFILLCMTMAPAVFCFLYGRHMKGVIKGW